MNVLVLNSGSSSLKFQVVDTDNEKALVQGVAEGIGLDSSTFTVKFEGNKDKKETTIADHNKAVELVIETVKDKIGLDNLHAVGHRVVHGGEFYSDSTIIDEDVMAKIEELFSLAPLHNPANLAGIKACKEIVPNLKQVAVFDTAFHQTIPKENYLYSIPYSQYDKYKIRKYGFHGTSHRFVTAKAKEILPNANKIITCHLGNGSSLCAVKDGKSVNTTMGFTPLQGLKMGTRSGDIDASIVQFLMEKENISVDEIMNMLNKESGLKGICGDSDMRAIHEKREEGSEKHELAFKMLTHRLRTYIGAYMAELNGVDAIIFTGGIGENDEFVREDVCKNLSGLGVKLDVETNLNTRGTGKISTDDSEIAVHIIETNEELMIAKDTAKLIE